MLSAFHYNIDKSWPHAVVIYNGQKHSLEDSVGPILLTIMCNWLLLRTSHGLDPAIDLLSPQ